jgi:hypothetical protein
MNHTIYRIQYLHNILVCPWMSSSDIVTVPTRMEHHRTDTLIWTATMRIGSISQCEACSCVLRTTVFAPRFYSSELEIDSRGHDEIMLF